MLGDAIKELDQELQKTLQFFEALDVNDIPTLGKSFLALRRHKDTLDALNTILASLYKKYSEEVIPSVLEATGMDSINVEGHSISVNARLFASIKADNKKEAFSWLREQQFNGLIKEEVNAQSLSSVMKAYTEDTGKLPPECISIHMKTYTSIRKK